MKQENRWITLIKEQRILVFILSLALLLLMGLFLISSRNNDRSLGDTAGPNSGAFLIYKNETFSPFGNLRADNFVRDDVAYYARKTMEAYDVNKNPGVVFIVSDFTVSEKTKVSFKGKYEKVKGEVSISAEHLAYDRVKVSIRWNDTDIDSQLPSANKRNRFIISLPVEQGGYQLSFSPESDLFVITPTIAGEAAINSAVDFLRVNLEELYSDDSYMVHYPAYLKGEPQHSNTIDEYDFHEDDHYDE